MPDVMREVTWGEALVVQQFKYPGGLRAAVAAIHREMGPYVGVRSTFAKLGDVRDPFLLNERDRLRAWLLLSTFGEDPQNWGIPDDSVPLSYRAAHIRERLAAARGTEGSPRYYSSVAHATGLQLRDAA